jgi:hypothetical protein
MLTTWEASSVDRPDESLRNPKRTMKRSRPCPHVEALVGDRVIHAERIAECA